ncbi:hypothetical protein BZA05DRAFT_408040, partial [Tricharina praecox]|uniref:uncharacterized protein n=1 Tax=Tricharina praecox TaxID=43433 RepID=UPI00221E58B4
MCKGGRMFLACFWPRRNVTLDTLDTCNGFFWRERRFGLKTTDGPAEVEINILFSHISSLSLSLGTIPPHPTSLPYATLLRLLRLQLQLLQLLRPPSIHPARTRTRTLTSQLRRSHRRTKTKPWISGRFSTPKSPHRQRPRRVSPPLFPPFPPSLSTICHSNVRSHRTTAKEGPTAAGRARRCRLERLGGAPTEAGHAHRRPKHIPGAEPVRRPSSSSSSASSTTSDVSRTRATTTGRHHGLRAAAAAGRAERGGIERGGDEEMKDAFDSFVTHPWTEADWCAFSRISGPSTGAGVGGGSGGCY